MYGIFTGGDYQKSTIRLSRRMKLVPHSGPIPSFYRMILPSLLTCKKISSTFTIQATTKSNYLSNNPFYFCRSFGKTHLLTRFYFTVQVLLAKHTPKT